MPIVLADSTFERLIRLSACDDAGHRVCQFLRHQSDHGERSIEWSECDLVETNPMKLSGVPILKGTRVQADSIVENLDGT